MKIIENVIKILLVLLLFFVLLYQSDQYVDLRIFTLYFQDQNLSIVLLITLGLGAVLGALLLGFNFIQVRSENRLLQKKNVQLTKELENLRNISIDEIPDEGAGDNIESKGV
ncbi:MAG: DUF1049 domain-containing protein [Spirochaetes bacterium]|nr:DUF1049 domain-containing protein [Spirochaetota bacterium]